MKQSRFQEFIEWLLDNLFDIVTILVAGYLVIRYQITAPTPDDIPAIVTWILSVLALIAISGLWERNRRLHRIEKSTNKLISMVNDQIVDKPSAMRFFENSPALDSYFKTADTIDLMGVSLTSTLDRQASNIREAIKNGTNVRVILMNPSSKSFAVKMSTLRSEEPDNEAYYRKKLATAFEVIEYLKRKQGDQSTDKGYFDVHLINYAPSFGILSFNYEKPNGIIFVEIYPHGSGYDTQIAFNLTSKRDGKWFSYFQSQFEDVWKNSTEWNGESYKPQRK
ncbi:MAG TPA: hypothetical protein PKK96_13980 [Anaerolineales bacterium]|nr:hypothetical protein [Anaerolineales bacterium]HNS62109.1 hypothetical protein [Anaerolineales bacterium]